MYHYIIVKINILLYNAGVKKAEVDEKFFIASAELYLLKSGGKIIFSLISGKNMLFFADEPVEPEILYSGGENALFRRRPDQFIFLEKVPDEFFSEAEVRDVIFNRKETVFTEKKTASSPAREYTVKFRLVIEKLESSEAAIQSGYPFFTSLRALVCANMDKPIADIIGKDDCINLAAVLAREENYALLEKYFSEKLPINEKVSPLFKEWRPTVLFYITTNRLVGFMEDPLKLIRYLAANGADPNMPSEEGDTPLGNQCLDNGLYITMKTLLEIGADPNRFTEIKSGPIKPLHLLLLPSGYNEETREVKLIGASCIEKIKLLVNSGADVNYSGDSGFTALSMAINNSEGKARGEIVRFLLKNGADEQSAVDSLKKDVELGHSKSAFSLYEIYSGRIEGLTVKPDSDLARKYLCVCADLLNKPNADYKIADTDDALYGKEIKKG